jgi:hypothetical protein
VLRTKYFDTLYSGVVQTWTPWCGVSYPPPRGRSHRQRLAGELLENSSMKNPSLGVEVVGARPHDTRCSPLASSSGHSAWLVIGGGGGAPPRGTWPCPCPTDPSGMSRIASSEVLVHSICHIELCIIRYLHTSSRL